MRSQRLERFGVIFWKKTKNLEEGVLDAKKIRKPLTGNTMKGAFSLNSRSVEIMLHI